MPIQALLDADPDHFEPDEIAKIVAGFEAALTTLDITNRKGPTASIIAKIIFDAAKQGELDPERLRDIAVNAFLLWAEIRLRSQWTNRRSKAAFRSSDRNSERSNHSTT